jgi:hypothetical protein
MVGSQDFNAVLIGNHCLFLGLTGYHLSFRNLGYGGEENTTCACYGKNKCPMLFLAVLRFFPRCNCLSVLLSSMSIYLSTRL